MPYESDKSYSDDLWSTISFKRRREDEDKDEEPSARSNRGSRVNRAGKIKTGVNSAPKGKDSKTNRKSTEKHCHPKACRRSSVRCQKLPNEAQPHKARNNKLMRIDELHKFNDGTLNDVRTALDDILKRIGMKYLPQMYWKKVDTDRAGAMIQAIDK
ncbi:hypothetical protein Tco_0925908 [Tanacetum coccineum]|uniref:Uncharacterized protein n=1 Tax=Tanacetum coccineum TaxID=301880 RepID=A0ABQ5DEI0_9ASTR